jgi:hypothetical protein
MKKVLRQEDLDGKTVIRVDFSGSEKPYSCYGRYYKRVFDRTEETFSISECCRYPAFPS